MFDKIVESYKEHKLLKSLDRIARSIERVGDLLEALLPSPLTQSSFVDNNQKPRGEDTLKVYGEKEAYWDEVNKIKEELDFHIE